MKTSGEKGSMRWLILGLSAHGLAAALLLANVLSSDTERGPRSTPEAEPEAPVTPAQGTAGVPKERNALDLRVESATEALALGLEAPDFEDGRWQAELEQHAETLGREALPALREILADGTRRPEEAVAAGALEQRLAR